MVELSMRLKAEILVAFWYLETVNSNHARLTVEMGCSRNEYLECIVL